MGWPAWLAALVVAVGYSLYAARRLPMIAARVFEAHPLKLVAIPMAVICGTMEELWFRRQLMNWAQGQGLDIVAQIAVSAAIFGLAHACWGLLARKLRVAMHSMGATTVLGPALGAVYVLAGRHVAPCVWSHIAINLLIEP